MTVCFSPEMFSCMAERFYLSSVVALPSKEEARGGKGIYGECTRVVMMDHEIET